jgi:Domain of Unknown Function (DUF928)
MGAITTTINHSIYIDLSSSSIEVSINMHLYLTQTSPVKLTTAWVTIISLLFGSQPVMAQETALHYIPDPTFAALSKKGTPKDIMRGGGKRGCLNLKMADTTQGLKAIVPPQEGGGLSISASPTFWVQNPYMAEHSITAVLSIRKAGSFAAQPLQKVQVKLPTQPGLVGVKLPKTITEQGLLAWTLTVVCDAENSARNPFVSGLVMIKPNADLSKRIAGLSKKDQAMEFMRSGYWYDALSLIEQHENVALRSLIEPI